MKLRPQPHKLRKPHKHNLDIHKIKYNKLIYGNYGMKILNNFYLHPRQIESVRKIIVRHLRNTGFKFHVWNRSFPHWGFTSKSIGTRMGKGKGKVNHWFYKVHKGQILFEWFQDGLLEEIVAPMIRECNHKLPVKITFIKRI